MVNNQEMIQTLRIEYACMYVVQYRPLLSTPLNNSKLIFLLTIETRILSFLVEHYTIKTDIKYYSIAHK